MRKTLARKSRRGRPWPKEDHVEEGLLGESAPRPVGPHVSLPSQRHRDDALLIRVHIAEAIDICEVSEARHLQAGSIASRRGPGSF